MESWMRSARGEPRLKHPGGIVANEARNEILMEHPTLLFFMLVLVTLLAWLACSYAGWCLSDWGEQVMKRDLPMRVISGMQRALEWCAGVHPAGRRLLVFLGMSDDRGDHVEDDDAVPPAKDDGVKLAEEVIAADFVNLFRPTSEEQEREQARNDLQQQEEQQELGNDSQQQQELGNDLEQQAGNPHNEPFSRVYCSPGEDTAVDDDDALQPSRGEMMPAA